MPTPATLAGARPNIVFILTDDQGYGEVGRHGNRIIQTPTLDRLHDEGVRFTRFHVSPTCAPTRAALMTGRHEFRNRVTHTILGRSLLREDAVTLPQLLGEAGYRTALFGKWHLGDNYPCRPRDRGFEVALWHGGGGMTQTPDYWGNTYFDPVYRYQDDWRQESGYCTDIYFRHAADWIEQHRAEPFFCYLPTNAPHRPLQVEERYSELYAAEPIDPEARRYYGMITNIDENVDRLLAHLDRLGLTDNTLVIFMGDNGSAEAGNPRRGLWNAGQRGGKGTCYEGGTRVPSFWRWPALGGGRAVDALCAHVDFLPTLVELAGGRPPDGLPLEGRSLVPLLADSAAPWPDRKLVVHVGRWDVDEAPEDYRWRNTAVRSTRWRLVNGRELYDLAADPGETTDVAADHPEVVAEHRAFYDDWWAEVLPEVKTPVRLKLGDGAENPAWLTCHDWHASRLAPDDPTQRQLAVWQQECLAAVASGEGWQTTDGERRHSGLGAWAVTITRPGSYVFRLRKVPAAAAPELRRLAAGAAHLRCGETTAEAPVAEGDEQAELRLDLPAGDAWLEGWFTGQTPAGRPLGAFFVEVERLG